MYLLTPRPLGPDLLAHYEPPGVRLWRPDPAWIPHLVRALPHGGLYEVASSKGCGCGFEGLAYLEPLDDEVRQWRSEMTALQNLIEVVLREHVEVTLCTGWDFLTSAEPVRVPVRDLAGQVFDEEDLVTLIVSR
ncbi:hypothetical protein DFI_10485 [Deinococcus ficus]|uniref:Uncharacterized protein n=2 Tax=Deinococcus ficus TaxID=317577 RepID=A0A221SXK9_9DEIO|nr:hypothetical protein DFI_10485 [Deinococcus ficus]